MSQTKLKPPMNHDELSDRLLAHLLDGSPNGHKVAVIREVRNGTGYSRREGYCDAISMGLWPSRGLELVGYEVKASRADWLRELKKPEKAEAFHPYCHRWYLVVSDPAFVHEGELPESWGLIAPKGKGLTKIKQAPYNAKPKAVDATFLAALLRCAVQVAASRKQLAEAREKGYEEGKKQGANDKAWVREELEILRENARLFEEAAGIKMADRFHFARHKPDELGAALKAHLEGTKNLDRLHGRLARIHSDTAKLLDEYGIDPENPPKEF